MSDKPAAPCSCSGDPYADLPPDLRPKPENPLRKAGLRQVTCPGCGMVYWSNREVDLCTDCEKKGGGNTG